MDLSNKQTRTSFDSPSTLREEGYRHIYDEVCWNNKSYSVFSGPRSMFQWGSKNHVMRFYHRDCTLEGLTVQNMIKERNTENKYKRVTIV